MSVTVEGVRHSFELEPGFYAARETSAIAGAASIVNQWTSSVAMASFVNYQTSCCSKRVVASCAEPLNVGTGAATKLSAVCAMG